MVNPQLAELQELGICDEETVERLSIDDDFIKERIAKVLERLNKDTRYETTDSLGRKLLFLEDLLDASQEHQQAVKEWFEDEKRKFLFDYSPQGQLYGQLLLAKAGWSLPEFRKRFNPQAAQQRPFTFEKTLVLENVVQEEAEELLERKTNAVISEIRKELFGEVWDAVEKCFDEKYFKKLIGDGKKIPEQDPKGPKRYQPIERYKLALNKAGVVAYEVQMVADMIDCFYAGIDKEGHLRFPENLEEAIREVKEETYDTIKTYERENIDPLIEVLEALIKSGKDDTTYELDLARQTERLELTREQSAEIEALRCNYAQLKKKRSEKIGRAKKLIYTIELADKDPLDVRFGNDSGACIGIFPEREGIGNAYGLPAMLADNATYIFNVKQQIDRNVKRRVGMVLAFDTKSEKGEKVLTVNSSELSPNMNPATTLEAVVDFCEESLIAFGRSNGFQAAIMSNHDYNTSRNYSKRKGGILFKEKLQKPRQRNEPPFYTEILTKDGKVNIKGIGVYVLYDDRSK